MASLKTPPAIWVRTGTWTLGHWPQNKALHSSISPPPSSQATQLLLYPTSFTLMICSTKSRVNYLQLCTHFSPWWVWKRPHARLSLILRYQPIARQGLNVPQAVLIKAPAGGQWHRVPESLARGATKDIPAQFPGEYRSTCPPAPSRPLQQ